MVNSSYLEAVILAKSKPAAGAKVLVGANTILVPKSSKGKDLKNGRKKIGGYHILSIVKMNSQIMECTVKF